jgi:hypothetical protein
MAAKKSERSNSDRHDPKKNKSLAIRNVIQKMPNAKATELAEAVKKEYGHNVKLNMIYMVKTKSNMAADGRPKSKKVKSKSGDTPMTSPALWIDAIRTARLLLKATGSVANATALLKAVDG